MAKDLNVTSKDAKSSAWKMMQIAGLAVSIPFELLAGPFIGYFIGAHLENKFGTHPSVTYIFIAMGFVASVYNAVLIIAMMIKINRENG